MKLNYTKSSLMCFNYTKNYQFTTRITMDNYVLPVLTKTKLLGVIITNDIKWSENAAYLVKRANARMELLRRMVPFGPSKEDMKTIYIAYIRSILEQSCTIWHSDLNLEDRLALERVQKNAFRNILQDKYETYEKALIDLNMETLFARREKLILTFGKKCLNLPQTKYLFPLNENEHSMDTRHKEKYQVTKARTERLNKSSIPYMQRLLDINHSEEQKKKD